MNKKVLGLLVAASFGAATLYNASVCVAANPGDDLTALADRMPGPDPKPTPAPAPPVIPHPQPPKPLPHPPPPHPVPG